MSTCVNGQDWRLPCAPDSCLDISDFDPFYLFVWPITGDAEKDKISEAFGPRLKWSEALQMYVWDYHEGIDIATVQNDRDNDLDNDQIGPKDVHAVWGGVVVEKSGNCINPCGCYVVLRHEFPGASDVYTRYCHLSADSKWNTLNKGQSFAQGAHFANSGRTGDPAVPYHLHFETMLGGNDFAKDTVNPLRPHSLFHFPNETPIIALLDVAGAAGSEHVTLQIHNTNTPKCPIKELGSCNSQFQLNHVRLEILDSSDDDYFYDSVFIDFDQRIRDGSPVSGGNNSGTISTTTFPRFDSMDVTISPTFLNSRSDGVQEIEFRFTLPSSWREVEDFRSKLTVRACNTWDISRSYTCDDYCTTKSLASTCDADTGDKLPSTSARGCDEFAIVSPEDGATIQEADEYGVEVSVPPVYLSQVANIHLEVSDGTQLSDPDGLAPYIVYWTPNSPGVYDVTATAVDSYGGSIPGLTHTISVTVEEVVEAPLVYFDYPTDQSQLPSGATTVVVRVEDDEVVPSSQIDVEVLDSSGTFIEYLTLDDWQDGTAPDGRFFGEYFFEWEPTLAGSYSLLVNVTDTDLLEGSQEIDVIVEASVGSISGLVWDDTDNPNGQVDDGEAPRANQIVYLDRSNPPNDQWDPDVDLWRYTQDNGSYSLPLPSSLPPSTYTLRQLLPDGWGFTAPVGGEYLIDLNAGPAQTIEDRKFGNRCLEDCSPPPDPDETLIINDHAFMKILRLPFHIRNLVLRNPFYPERGGEHLETSEHACGLVGFDAQGGDINENDDSGTLIEARVYEDSQGLWVLTADFRHDPAGSELWDPMHVLCIDRDVAALGGPAANLPIFFESFPGITGGHVRNTQISSEAWQCGLAGFKATGGDIQEDKAGDIFKAEVYPHAGTWKIRADFRTDTEYDEESWRVDLMCVDARMAASGSNLSDKPFFFHDFPPLGDNVNTDTVIPGDFPDGIPTSDYVCGIAGAAALHGDINERGSDGTLIVTRVFQENGRWRLRADFRTHTDDESWKLRIFCARRESWVIPPPPLEVSSFHPSEGSHLGDREIHIYGSGFLPEGGPLTPPDPVTSVSFGNAEASFSVESDFELVAISPPGLVGSTVAITVTRESGAVAVAEGLFHYRGLSLAGAQPSLGAEGTVVLLTGGGFLDDSMPEVRIGGVAVTPFNVADSQMNVVIPPPANGWGSVDVEVDIGSDQALLPDGFTYSPPDIGVTPSQLRFVGVALPGESRQNLLVENHGLSMLTVSSVSLIQGPLEAFLITSGGGSFSLEQGQSRAIEIYFERLDPGDHAATLRLESNDPDQPTLDVAIEYVEEAAQAIQFESAVSGWTTGKAMSFNSQLIAVDPGDVLVAAVSTKPYRDVSQVTSNGLVWSEVADYRSGRGTTGVSLWWALAGSQSPVTATVHSASESLFLEASVVVSRYSGAAPDPVLDVLAANTNGTWGGSSGGVDSTAYGFAFQSTDMHSMVVAAIASNDRTHAPGQGFTERLERHSSSGSGQAGVALMDQYRFAPMTAAVNGNFTGPTDWAVVAVSLRPNTAGEGTPDIGVEEFLDLGLVEVGQSASATLTIENVGSGILSIDALEILSSSEFRIGATSGSSLLSAGARLEVEIIFEPVSSGPRLAALRIESNDPDDSPFFVSLEGAASSGQPPKIAVTPDGYEFRDVPLGEQVSQIFTLSNLGSETLTIEQVDLVDDHGNAFTLNAPSGQQDLQAGETMEVEVEYTPPMEGTQRAELRVDSNDPVDPSVEVGLRGISTLQSALHTLLFDDFEDGNPFLHWEESGGERWHVEAASERSVPDHPEGNRVAHSDGCSSEPCVLTLAAPIDLRGYAGGELSFWRYADDSLDEGEYLSVEIRTGSAWEEVFYWAGEGLGAEDDWHHETLDLSAYLIEDFQVRFVSSQSSTGEDAEIDDVWIRGLVVDSGENQPPQVSAGTDQTIYFPASALLQGEVSDDGQPDPPAQVTSEWSRVSGPGTVSFGDASSPSTTASFSTAGTYVLQLTAEDGLATGSDTMTVTVEEQGGGGEAQTLFFDDFETENPFLHWEESGDNRWHIEGPSDDSEVPGHPSSNEVAHSDGCDEEEGGCVLTLAEPVDLRGYSGATLSFWRFIDNGFDSDPGDSLAVEVWNGAAWQEILRWTEADGDDAWHYETIDLSSYLVADFRVRFIAIQETSNRDADIDDVLIEAVGTGGGGGEVDNQPPQASAGADQTVTLPASATLSGSASDDGLPDPPGELSVSWSKMSGPGSVDFSDATSMSTIATFTEPGSYELQILVDDGDLTDSDRVTVTVEEQGGGGEAQTLFFDDFETENPFLHWQESGDNRWHIEGPSDDSEVPGHPSSNEVAHSDGCDEEEGGCVLTLAEPVDLRGYSGATLSFWRFIDNGFDSDPGDSLAVELWDGDAWQEILRWTEADGDDAWHYETIDLSSYLVADFRVRFIAIQETSNRDADIDDVLIEAVGTGGGGGEVDNQPPQASAGADQTVTFPASATLSGSASDDGLPDPPGELSVSWSQVSGPGSVSFSDSTSVSTIATFTEPGSYELQILVDDGDLTDSDRVTVTVEEQGSGGEAQTLFFDDFETDNPFLHWQESGDNRWHIEGPSDDSEVPGHPSSNEVAHSDGCDEEEGGCVLTLAEPVDLRGYSGATLSFWRFIDNGFDSDPGDSLAVEVWNGAAWQEILRWTEADGDDAWHYETIDLSSYLVADFRVRFIAIQETSNRDADIDDVLIEAVGTGGGGGEVDNQPPQASAGADQTVTLPASATLSGSASDDGLPDPPGELSVSWSKMSGPGSVDFSDATSMSTIATFTEPGSYELQILVDDGDLTDSDRVTVTVEEQGGGGEAQTLFFDDFETENPFLHWQESGDNRWHIEGPSDDSEVPGHPSSNEVAHSDGCDEEEGGCVLTLAEPVDLRGYSGATLSFWRFIDNGFDSDPGDSLAVELWDGDAWQEILRWTEADGDDAWHYETIDLSSYLVADFRVRFIAIQETSNRDADIDDVLIEAVGTGGGGGEVDNQPPQASAGADQTVTFPASATLSGSASDDGLPDPPGELSVSWSKVSGPGSVSFSDAASVSTIATFTEPGSYELQILVDDGDLTDSDRVTVTVEEQGSGGEAQTLFFDDFETDNLFLHWQESGDNRWHIEGPSDDSEVPGHPSSNEVAHSDGCDEEEGGCVLTLAEPVDLRGYSGATLSFWRFIDNGFDSDPGDSLAVEVWNGAAWQEILRWTEADGDDAWHYETIDLSSYLVADFRVRFIAIQETSNRDADIDDVLIEAVGTGGGGG